MSERLRGDINKADFKSRIDPQQEKLKDKRRGKFLKKSGVVLLSIGAIISGGGVVSAIKYCNDHDHIEERLKKQLEANGIRPPSPFKGSDRDLSEATRLNCEIIRENPTVKRYAGQIEQACNTKEQQQRYDDAFSKAFSDDPKTLPTDIGIMGSTFAIYGGGQLAIRGAFRIFEERRKRKLGQENKTTPPTT